MAEKTVFDDNIATALLANQSSSILGPGRLARCREVQIVVKLAPDCTAGAFAIKEYDSQACAGVGYTHATLNAPGAGSETIRANLAGIFGFLRVEASGAVNGAGAATIQARGN